MTAPSPSPRARTLAVLLLIAFLALLATRMASSETLRESLNQQSAQLAEASKSAPPSPPFIGPAHLFIESAIALLLAAATGLLAASARALSKSHLLQLVLTTALLACGLFSTLHAANRFAAAVGLADVAMLLAAGWSASVLLSLSGDTGRRTLAAGLVAILTLWLAKGLLQYAVEFPDLAAYFREHQDEALRSQGITDPVQAQLYLSRANAGELSSYLALSNVFANGLVGLLPLLSGTLAYFLLRPRTPPTAARADRAEIPLDLVGAIAGGILLFLGLFELVQSGSNGGIAMGILATLLAGAGVLLWPTVLRLRKPLIAVGLALLVLGAAGVIGYGLTKDSLPSKSLSFRWHYWTASAPMVREQPVTGVGFNNFGDQYLRFKRPSSPEEVKDPHSFFVRWAAEAGLPAALLVAALLAWKLSRGLRVRPALATSDAAEPAASSVVALALAACAGWAVVHLAFFEEPIEFTIAMTVIFALLAAGMALGTWLILTPSAAGSRRPSLRFLAPVAALAALAMLVYDQINMALVTGPVAMLFWMLLSLADDAPAERPSAKIAWLAPVPFLAAAVLPLSPVLRSWDPAPYESAYLAAYQARNSSAALAALNEAIARAPHSIELRMQRLFLLRDVFRQPVAEEIRHILALDRSTARIRLTLALPESDLPPAERILILEEALALDAQFPPDEIKRLSAGQVAQARQTIARLKTPATRPG